MEPNTGLRVFASLKNYLFLTSMRCETVIQMETLRLWMIFRASLKTTQQKVGVVARSFNLSPKKVKAGGSL